MHISKYLGLLMEAEKQLSKSFILVANNHQKEPDIYTYCVLLAAWSEKNITNLQKFTDFYYQESDKEPERLRKALFKKPRSKAIKIIKEFHNLWIMANEAHICWIIILQAAKALRDSDLRALCEDALKQNERQLAWLLTRLKQATPQSLVVAE